RAIGVAGAQDPGGGGLDGARHREPARRRAERGLEIADRALEHRGARVAHAVHAVAHPHDAAAGGGLGLEPGLGARGLADRVEHVEHRPGRAAVQRALSAPIAPVTAEIVSDAVEAITRAVNVEAFMPWSDTVTR